MNKTTIVPSLYVTLRRLLLTEYRLLSGGHAETCPSNLLSEAGSS
jgi:hypothetical protein